MSDFSFFFLSARVYSKSVCKHGLLPEKNNRCHYQVLRYEKSPGLVKYLENKEFLGKMIQTKVVEFKKIYLLITFV